MKIYNTTEIIGLLMQWVNDKTMASAIMGQFDVETAGFTQSRENMRYSKTDIIKLCPSLNSERATSFAQNPQLWANYYYSNLFDRGKSLGNGDQKSGDGWNYRGAGLLMLSGKRNFINYSKFCGSYPKILNNELEIMPHAFNSAKWFLNGMVNFLLTKKQDLIYYNQMLSRAINGKYVSQKNIDNRLNRSNYYFKIINNQYVR